MSPPSVHAHMGMHPNRKGLLNGAHTPRRVTESPVAPGTGFTPRMSMARAALADMLQQSKHLLSLVVVCDVAISRTALRSLSPWDVYGAVELPQLATAAVQQAAVAALQSGVVDSSGNDEGQGQGHGENEDTRKGSGSAVSVSRRRALAPAPSIHELGTSGRGASGGRGAPGGSAGDSDGLGRG